jgi:hypothetical protein
MRKFDGERTLDRLKKKHPELEAAIRMSRDHVVAVAQGALMKNINAGDTVSIIYALKIYGGDYFNDRVLRILPTEFCLGHAKFCQAKFHDRS